MKKIFFTALLAAIALGAAFLVGEKPAEAPAEAGPLGSAPRKDDEYKRAVVTLAGESFIALVSDTPELRSLGLSGRKDLGEGEAMLFVFDAPEAAGFWMKDMLFSIDIVWVGEDGRIISMEKGVSPLTFPKTFFPARPAKYVLEFRAGTIDSLGAREGDAVFIEVGK